MADGSWCLLLAGAAPPQVQPSPAEALTGVPVLLVGASRHPGCRGTCDRVPPDVSQVPGMSLLRGHPGTSSRRWQGGSVVTAATSWPCQPGTACGWSWGSAWPGLQGPGWCGF